jgi:hypothetical protein
MATQPRMSDFLRSGAVVRAPSGVPFRVSPLHAGRFRNLAADIESRGVTIDPTQSGGFADRNIAGTNTPSRHSRGEAVDVNWGANPRTGAPLNPMVEMVDYEAGIPVNPNTPVPPVTRIPPQIAREVAAANGMTWGGDWRNSDPMHFEVARGNLPPVPVQNRSITGFAGAQPPAQPSPQPPPVTPPPHSATLGPDADAIVRGAQQAQMANSPWETTTTNAPLLDKMQMMTLAKALQNNFNQPAPRVAQAPPQVPLEQQAPQWISSPFRRG